ncbi:conserved hypothetical protein [delta proteobacterium NaphS2]|nr:conserved hypothetical protein [delta proteobacterium NaphS2]
MKNLKSKGTLFCMAVMIITIRSKKVMPSEKAMIRLLSMGSRVSVFAVLFGFP